MKFTAAATLFVLSITAGNVEAALRSKHPPIQSRIVGGFPSSSSAFPYFTTTDTDTPYCGASLIHSDIVMTAAHCQGAFDDGVRVGVHDFDDSSDGYARSVVREVKHPQYDDFTTANDIMLLKLSSPVPSFIQPVPFETSSNSPSNREVLTVMGFGATSEGGDGSSVLMQVDVKHVDDNTCIAQYGQDVEMDVMFCAGVTGGGKDSCQGDSGGPLIDQSGVQVGIVSWGEGCARATHSGVYTRVGAFGNWIEDQICAVSSEPPSYCGGNSGGGDDGSTGGGDGSTGDMIDVLFAIDFDYYPEETTWTLVQLATPGSNEKDQTISVGPDFWPTEYEHYEMTMQLESGKDFALTIDDTYGDGFEGTIVISEINAASGAVTQNLLTGSGSSFEYSLTMTFSTGSGSDGLGNSCEDSTKTFFLESDLYGSCDIVSSGFQNLCGFIDIALECPVTCGVCDQKEEISDSKCGSDNSGRVSMGDFLGEQSCSWLRESMQGSSRYDFLCLITEVALHCPYTCKTCDVATKMTL